MDLVDTGAPATVLLATKALAVACRNSSANQAAAVQRGLLHRCIALLESDDLGAYMAKWVILVMNALVYDNPEARSGRVPALYLDQSYADLQACLCKHGACFA